MRGGRCPLRWVGACGVFRGGGGGLRCLSGEGVLVSFGGEASGGAFAAARRPGWGRWVEPSGAGRRGRAVGEVGQGGAVGPSRRAGPLGESPGGAFRVRVSGQSCGSEPSGWGRRAGPSGSERRGGAVGLSRQAGPSGRAVRLGPWGGVFRLRGSGRSPLRPGVRAESPGGAAGSSSPSGAAGWSLPGPSRRVGRRRRAEPSEVEASGRRRGPRLRGLSSPAEPRAVPSG